MIIHGSCGSWEMVPPTWYPRSREENDLFFLTVFLQSCFQIIRASWIIIPGRLGYLKALRVSHPAKRQNVRIIQNHRLCISMHSYFRSSSLSNGWVNGFHRDQTARQSFRQWLQFFQSVRVCPIYPDTQIIAFTQYLHLPPQMLIYTEMVNIHDDMMQLTMVTDFFLKGDVLGSDVMIYIFSCVFLCNHFNQTVAISFC